MIELCGITKKYGAKTAVDSVSFSVGTGEIVGFLGPNGAGKTTTMNIITGYISSTDGSVTVDGFEILKNPLEVKKRIGYLPENPPLYLDMTVSEYLDFVCGLKGINENRQEHITKILELVRIEDVKGRIIKNLSKGYKQRVGIAQALVGDPEILILDEPTVGLDPNQINEIRTTIKELGKDRTVILSSHILPEICAVCERIIIINKGKIVADGSLDSVISSLSGKKTLTARIEGTQNDVKAVISQLGNVSGVSVRETDSETIFDYTISTIEGADIRRELFFALAANNMPLLLSHFDNASLEDVFLKLTTADDEIVEDVSSVNGEPSAEENITVSGDESTEKEENQNESNL